MPSIMQEISGEIESGEDGVRGGRDEDDSERWTWDLGALDDSGMGRSGNCSAGAETG
jgi:hypothetical protein